MKEPMKIQLTHGHPRLFLTPREIPEFRRKAKTLRRRYARMLLKKLEPLAASHWCAREKVQNHPEYDALALGQAWQLTRDEKYGRAAEGFLEGIEPFTAKGIGYDTWGVAAEALALTYDWLHDYWRARKLERQVAELTLFCARRALDDLLRLFIVDDWHNYALGLQGGITAAALAVGRDHPDLEDGMLLKTIHAIHFTGYRYHLTRLQDTYGVPPTVMCLDAALRASGGTGFACHLEASGSYHSVDAWDVVRMARYWSSALAGTEARPTMVWPELKLAGEALLRFHRPDGCNIVLGDATPFASVRQTRIANILYHLHRRTPDPVFAAHLRAFGHAAEGPFPLHLLLCAEEDSLPDARQRERFDRRVFAAWPASACIDPLAVMRSGWGETDTLLAFRCGRHGGWHNHLDHNSFTIFRGGVLALDSGGIDYGLPHRPEYSARTLAHNAILVRDPREKHWLGRMGQPTVNDGGQRLVITSYAPPNECTGKPHAILTEERRARCADEFNMGRMLAFESGAKVDYAAGDATRAYTYPWSGVGENPARRVEECVRQIVFLKPDLVIIFDRVEATRAAFEKKWLLHTLNAPRWRERGRPRQAARGIHTLPPQGPFEFSAGQGRLTVWPLLPETRRVRAVGGKGYECWVDHAVAGVTQVGNPRVSRGMNYPAPKGQNETGAWRIEVSPTQPAARDCFLTVLHAGLARERPGRDVLRCAAHLDGDTASLRVFRQHRGAWLPWASARFRTQGPVEVEYHFQDESGHFTAATPERVRKARR